MAVGSVACPWDNRQRSRESSRISALRFYGFERGGESGLHFASTARACYSFDVAALEAIAPLMLTRKVNFAFRAAFSPLKSTR